MPVTITIQGQKRVISNLDNLGRIKFKKPLTKASDMLMETFDRNFPAKGSELGEPWAKRKKNYPHPILQKTGKMRKGFTKKVSDLMAVIWNPVPYFKYHQLGTSKLPVRTMMKIDAQRDKEIVNIFSKYIDEHIKKYS